jgi:hypothetical protein
MIVKASTLNQRALSFISHNTDRVNVTALHLHHAGVEAGDPLAIAIHEACTKAKVKLLRHPPPNNEFGEGEVIAIAALRMIVKNKGANGGARVLKILNNAGRIPIGASEMKAVYYSIYHFSKKSGQTITDEELSEIIVTKGQKDWYLMAKDMREADKSIIIPLALSMCWGRAAQGKRRKVA